MSTIELVICIYYISTTGYSRQKHDLPTNLLRVYPF